ncbi:MAG TPA: hypothetical protein VGN57_15885 [Pirellulaceae bacterium]|jgi:hypothetical protein|nr:hypothetical protein [Pirellulaceae bacterium]
MNATNTPPEGATRGAEGRRLPRFNLKLVLLLGVLGSLLLAWLAPDAYWLRREREAVARIQAVRGNLVISEDNQRHISASEATAWRWWRRTSDVRYEMVLLDSQDGAGDEEVAHLPALRGVAFVSLRGPTFTDDSVAALGKLPKLGTLSLDDTRLTRAGLAELSALSPIDHLICHSAPGAPDLLESVDAIPDLRTLHGITLYLSLPAAEAIAKLERLESLQLHILGGVHPQALEPALRLPRLKTLVLNGPGVALGDEELKQVAQMTDLEVLSLASSEATDAALAELARLPRLRSLHIGSTGPTNAGVAMLAKIATLEAVDLVGWNVDDGALDSLRKLPKLKVLSVDDKLSLDALVKFRKDRPDCQIHRQANGQSALLEVWLERREEEAKKANAEDPP